MARYNDPWVFIAQIVKCQSCGAANRIYTDDPGLVPVCAQCKKQISAGSFSPTCADWKRIQRDKAGRILPPKPTRWYELFGKNLIRLFVEGSFQSREDRVRDAERLHIATQHCRILSDHELKIEQKRCRDEEQTRIESERYQQRLREESERAAAERRRRAEYNELTNVLGNLTVLSGRDFEIFLGRLFAFADYRVEVTQASCDYGIDLIIGNLSGGLLAIQAKHYAGAVGISAIQEAYTGMRYYKCHCGAVIAPGGFTRQARAVAAETGILLWGSCELRRFIDEGQWHDIPATMPS